jgi:uroporphyrinogen decarboxylase
MIRQYGGEYGIVGGLACTLFELTWYLRGMPQVLMDLKADQDFYDVYLSRLMRWIEVAGRNFAELGVDIIWIGDDFGMQNRMVISPALFRKFFKPRYARLFEEWKSINPQVKIAFHSDGNILPIIPDLIEIGLDILNPVQPKSMDPALVKKVYGDKLTFWGTVDIQEVLPFGAPEDVRNEVKLRVRTVGPGGGLILAPAHNIPADVPTENILAFYEAAKRYGRYPIAV